MNPSQTGAGRINIEPRAPPTAVETVCAHRAFISTSRGWSLERTKEPQSPGHAGRSSGNKKATWMTVRDFPQSHSLPLPTWRNTLTVSGASFIHVTGLSMLLTSVKPFKIRCCST